MSYELQVSEALPQGIKRIAYEQIDEALNYLQGADGEHFDDAVHGTRKCLKKLRGLLRLVRKEIGEETFKRENVCFRDAGRLLSDMRDKRVMIDVFDEVIAALNVGGVDHTFIEIREDLQADYESTRRRVVEEQEALQKAAVMLQSARLRVQEWPIEQHSFDCISGGLRKVYKRGRNRLADAAENPTAEAFHEWRKRVKYLWYSIRILQPLWPELLDQMSEEIHDLGDSLGDEHDLAELRKVFAGRPHHYADKADKLNILNHIERRRLALQEQAFIQGNRMYAETPGEFISRIAQYWEATPV